MALERKRVAIIPAERVERLHLDRLLRALPIRWRILSIAGLNTAVVLILAALIWNGAQVLSLAWDDLRQVQQSARLLVTLESEASRLQTLIHRYFNQPSPDLLNDIVRRREALTAMLRTRAAVDPAFAGSVDGLLEVTGRFLSGFDDLRLVQGGITRTYEEEVIKPARDMSGLYAIIDGATSNRGSLIWPSLGKSREAFSAAVLAANAYYLSLASDSAKEAERNLDTIEQTVPVMLDLADNDLQRNALGALASRTATLRLGLVHLGEQFTMRTKLLGETIDGNQRIMVGVIDQISSEIKAREEQAQARFDKELNDIYLKVGLVAAAFLSLIIVIGLAIARGISGPLSELKTSMHGIVGGDYDRRVAGLEARDEIGEMARSVDVFRENAIAKRRAEAELRASKDRAENALAELRDTQQSLIESEKLAALGGLVAGVAHEVNNPVGISLTVASSLARRCETFADELAKGQLRKSRLDEFIAGTQEAAKQLVANLQRAGELIQSFKQVAVDRSHDERRPFNLHEATDQIISSLRPGLKKTRITTQVDIPADIVLDSYPGHYGQVLTNLCLNAATHAFSDGQEGVIRVEAQLLGGQVQVVVADNGNGMTDDVQRRAFNPFFTTRRGQGGSGLGLHIVHTLVTRRLGGRIAMSSAPGRGTSFLITLPLRAPREEAAPDALQYMDR